MERHLGFRLGYGGLILGHLGLGFVLDEAASIVPLTLDTILHE